MRFTTIRSLLAGGLVAACAHVSHNGRDAPAPARVPVHADVITRLAQIDYGREARFASCAGEACPAVTPKTLAISDLQPTRTAIELSAVASPPPTPEPPKSIAPWPYTVTVEFSAGAAALTARDRMTLWTALPIAKRATRIVIRGRTDDVGTAAINDKLALQRAITVRNYMRQHLAAAGNAIVITSKGACCYVAGNDSADGRARNRRVEIEFQNVGEAS